MTLADAPVGHDVRVITVVGETDTARRLMEMGVVPGVAVKIIKSAPFGDPIQLRLLGYDLAVRKTEANIVEVEVVTDRSQV